MHTLDANLHTNLGVRGQRLENSPPFHITSWNFGAKFPSAFVDFHIPWFTNPWSTACINDIGLLSPGIRIFGELGRGRFDSFKFHNPFFRLEHFSHIWTIMPGFGSEVWVEAEQGSKTPRHPDPGTRRPRETGLEAPISPPRPKTR